MQVNVRIFGEIASIVGAELSTELDDHATVRTLTNIIADKAGQRKGFLGEFRVGSEELAIMINGKNIIILDGLNTTLSDGDLVVIMPSIFGGY
jgi:molybdopterin converting factor small subunit